MALPASALTTVATLVDELDVDEADKVRARLERYIRVASSLVATILGDGRPRQLHRGTVTEMVAGYDRPLIMVSTTPVVSITSITIDDDEVDTDTYEIEDADAGFIRCIDGVWSSTALAEGGPAPRLVPGTERKAIEVVYVGGWVTPGQVTNELARTLPEAIEDAVVELVTSRWRRRGNDLRVRSSGYEASTYTFGGEPIPPEVMAALGPYVRIGSA